MGKKGKKTKFIRNFRIQQKQLVLKRRFVTMSVHIEYFNLIMCLKALDKWKEAKSNPKLEDRTI